MPKAVIGNFSIQKNCTYLEIDGRKECVSKFAAKVSREIEVNKIDGTRQVLLEISGQQEDGTSLPKFVCPSDASRLLKLISTNWGPAAGISQSLPGITPTNLKRRLADWILLSNPGHRKERHYEHTGFTLEDPPAAFVLRSGAITSEGIDSLSTSVLPKHCIGDHTPLPLKHDHMDLTSAIEQVLSFAEPSATNADIQCIPLSAALRAVTSTFRAPDGVFYLLGESAGGLGSMAKLARSFFGELNENSRALSWDIPEKDLNAALRATRNGVLVLQDTAHSFSRRVTDKKIEKILGKLCHGHGDPMLRCQVIGVGPYIPNLESPSLHSTVLYVPMKASEVDGAVLDPLWRLAKDGVYLQVMVGFVRYLLQDYAKRKADFDTKFQGYLSKAQERFPDALERAQQLASLVATWRLFLKFAEVHKVISHDDAEALVKKVRCYMVELAERQDALLRPNLKELFLTALREGLRAGKVHLLDANGGDNPLIADCAAVGWDQNQPHGEHIGWYDATDDVAYVKGGEGQRIVEILFNLIPMNYHAQFGASSKHFQTFWTRAKYFGVLYEVDDGRNTIRKRLPGSRPNQHHYPIRLGLKAEASS